MQRAVRLRRVGPASYGFTIPAEFVRDRGLCDGDTILWNSTADVAVLRFIKVMTQRPPALEAPERRSFRGGRIRKEPLLRDSGPSG